MTLEKKGATAGAAIFAALVVWELFFLRPGLGAPEELLNFAALFQAERWWDWLRFGGAAPSRGLQKLALALPWGWQGIYAVNAAALAVAFWGLLRLARGLGSEKAGYWALALALSAPFSFLQARTTFAYVLQPAFCVLWMLALRRAWGPGGALAVGFLGALPFIDYDAWVFALAAGAVAWASAPAQRRPKAAWLGLGLALGMGCVLAFSLEHFQEWWVLRVEAAPSTGQAGLPVLGGLAGNLKSYFVGGSHPKAMGLESLPTLPWWALPGLVAAAGAAPLWLWAWALFGLLGLAAAGPLQEPNRAIIAWPALLLLSGLGWERLLKARSRALLAACLVAGPFLGHALFSGAIRRWDAAIHGPSRRLSAAAGFLRGQGQGRLPYRLDLRDSYFLERSLHSGGSDSPGWVLVPQDLADPADGRWGRWQAFRTPDGGAHWLLLPSPQAGPWLRAAVDSPCLQPGFASLPAKRRLGALRQLPPDRPPLAASLEASARLRAALSVGAGQPDDAVFALSGRCLSAGPLRILQGAFAPPHPIGVAAGRELAALERPGERWRRLTRP